MEAKVIVFCFCSLVTLAYPFVLPPTDIDDDNDNMPSDQAGDLFRFLLLSRYGWNSPDYTAPDQAFTDYVKPISYDTEDKPMDFDNDEKPFNMEEKLIPYNADDFPFDKVNSLREMYPLPLAVKKYNGEQETTVTPTKEDIASAELSTSTSVPDLLASMPPVLPNKGQKEFVMLRPPTDNHRKIEHIMQEMANDMGMQAHRLEKKRWAM